MKRYALDENIFLEDMAGAPDPLGWYFSDEEQDVHGPFGSIVEARKELAAYAKLLR